MHMAMLSHTPFHTQGSSNLDLITLIHSSKWLTPTPCHGELIYHKDITLVIPSQALGARMGHRSRLHNIPHKAPVARILHRALIPSTHCTALMHNIPHKVLVSNILHRDPLVSTHHNLVVLVSIPRQGHGASTLEVEVPHTLSM